MWGTQDPGNTGTRERAQEHGIRLWWQVIDVTEQDSLRVLDELRINRSQTVF